MPVLNGCVASIKFSDNFVNGYYREQGQVVQNAQAIQSICNQTSDIITSGWNQRQKTYDILSQKRSDATMGYERVRDTDTGEIYKATVGFTDHDWHGKYEPQKSRGLCKLVYSYLMNYSIQKTFQLLLQKKITKNSTHGCMKYAMTGI